MIIERRHNPRVTVFAPAAIIISDRSFDVRLINLNSDGAQVEIPIEVVNLLAQGRPPDGTWPRTRLTLLPAHSDKTSGEGAPESAKEAAPENTIVCDVAFMRRVKQNLYVTGLKFVTPVPTTAVPIIDKLINQGKARLR